MYWVAYEYNSKNNKVTVATPVASTMTPDRRVCCKMVSPVLSVTRRTPPRRARPLFTGGLGRQLFAIRNQMRPIRARRTVDVYRTCRHFAAKSPRIVSMVNRWRRFDPGAPGTPAQSQGNRQPCVAGSDARAGPTPFKRLAQRCHPAIFLDFIRGWIHCSRHQNRTV